ncbi:FAD-dependent oxidoreductase [Lentzea sp. NPDC058450]|uniref:FAD-dependent oxidoreductase n=1 Tax=Lentzea sp. NPDC058450 TaxID=3346505 RepID=UPI003662CBA0
MTKALIVGGGISGLATALVLSRRGIEIDLVERAPRIEALGSGITLIGPALRALDGLGIYEECVAEGFGVTDFEIYTPDGVLADKFPLPSPVGTGQPGLLGMMRPTLHRILLDRAEAEGAVLRTGVSPVHIGPAGAEVEVAFDTGETGHYDLVIGSDGLRSTVRDLVFGPAAPEFQGQCVLRVVLPRPAEVTAEVQFRPAGDVTVGFTPTSADSMYMYCMFPVEAGYRPREEDLVDLVRTRIEPFGGVVARIRDEVREPGQINYAAFETTLAPGPWYRGRVLILGDAAHCTTPHLAAGAAMCLEDALALGEEIAAAPDLDDALRAFSSRRYDRCKYVVETSVQLSYWQTHPGTPGADHQRVMAEAFGRLAEPF